jgi:tetratricopeptide (TPR) repeat protein
LAFDRAAALYRQTLELQPDADHRQEWLVNLAGALANAGRPVQAADVYLTAAGETRGGRSVEWQRKAAELLLMGGHIDRGLAIIGSVLPLVGMRLAGGPRRALGSIVARRAALAWRGLHFEPHEASRVPRNDLLRIDTCWAITTGLLLVDTLRAASIQLQHLRIALDAGEPYRVARALALEACLSAASGGPAGIARSAAFAARADALARQVQHPHAVGLASLTAGVAAFVLGEWTRATELCERALTLFRDECTGVVWELTLAHNFYLGGLFYRGHVRRVSHWLPGLLDSAREHGNLYFEAELTTRFSMVWLAADDPDTGERLAREVNARWSARGFHRQHYNHLLAQGQTALYRGRAEEAWHLAGRQLAAVRRSQWHRVQIMRIETAFLEARSALAMASQGRDVPRLLAVASRAADRLAREHTPWSVPMSRLVAATVAHLERKDAAAIERLTAAHDAFEAADMQLYAAVARRRLGALLGGERGRALRQRTEEWMASQEIRNPGAMSRLIAPGLPD